jgi:predicted ATPase
MSAMRFERIELKNWKNFPSVDVKLASRVFLVGPNAIGKSNFLDAFRFLRDLVIEGGGLAQAVKVHGGMRGVRSLHAHRDSDVMVAATVLEESGKRWRYELAFTQEKLSSATRNGFVPAVKRELVQADGERMFFRPDDADREDPVRRSQTSIQQVQANKKFRALADFFAGVSYLHIVPQLLREGQPSPPDKLSADQYGRDLLESVRSAPPRNRTPRLGLIAAALQLVVPYFSGLKLKTDVHGQPHLEVKFAHWRQYGARQDEKQFSDGTLRLIGLLWALQEEAGPLLLEEPELSLHPAVVRQLAPLIHRAQVAGGGRQVIVSTHSPDLLMDEGIAPEELLMVQPGSEGSVVMEGASVDDIVKLMESGIPASEAVLPRTDPQQVLQFGSLFE